MSTQDDSVLPDNRDTFRPPEEERTPRGLAVALVASACAVSLVAGIVAGARLGGDEGTWQTRALAAVREAVEAGCDDVQVYGGVITGEFAVKRMDAAISSVRQLAAMQGYRIFQADSWSQGPESAGGAVVVAKCGG